MATRSALASLPARLRPTSAATAAGEWRRFLSHDRMGDTLKDHAEDKGLKDPTMKEELPSEPSGSNLLLQNVLNKREVDFERRLNEHRAYFELKKSEIDTKILKNAADSEGALSSFNRECISRFDTMMNILSLQNNKFNILKEGEDLRILQAHISILKGISWFVLTVGGGTITIYCRMKGIL